jgi:hypothetical protein
MNTLSRKALTPYITVRPDSPLSESSNRNLRTLHAVVTRGPPNMVLPHTKIKKLSPPPSRCRLICDRRSVEQSVLVCVRFPSGPRDQIFITVRHLRSSCCEEPSLTRERVCNLLVQVAATLRSKPSRTHDHILLSHLRLPQPGGPGLLYLIPQEQDGPVIPS